MGDFITNNLGTIAVVAGLAVVVGLIIFFIVRHKRRGGGCGGSCSGCPFSGGCGR